MHGSGHQIAVRTQEEQRREGKPMRPLQTFHVRPSLPPRLLALEGLAYNLRWSWDHDTINLFRRLDRDLWEKSGHNPVLLLGTLSQERLHEVAQDESFLAHMDRIDADLRRYMSGESAWYMKTYGPPTRSEVATRFRTTTTFVWWPTTPGSWGCR